MHRYMESHLRPRSRICYLSGGCLIRAEYDSVQAGQQGAFEASFGFNKTTKRRARPSHQLVDAQEPLATIGRCVARQTLSGRSSLFSSATPKSSSVLTSKRLRLSTTPLPERRAMFLQA